MLKIHEIREIIKLIDQSSINHFELESEGDKLIIKKEITEVVTQKVVSVVEPSAATPAPVIETPKVKDFVAPPMPEEKVDNAKKPETTLEEETLHKIVSPMVGTFYEAPSPGAKPFVSVGDTVEKNTVVCIIEAMKLFNEIEAEVRGKIVKVLVENGQLVEYGQPLFLVKPE